MWIRRVGSSCVQITWAQNGNDKRERLCSTLCLWIDVYSLLRYFELMMRMTMPQALRPIFIFKFARHQIVQQCDGEPYFISPNGKILFRYHISNTSATMRIVVFDAQSAVSIACWGAVMRSPECGARVSFPRWYTHRHTDTDTYRMLIVLIFICLLLLFMANKFSYFAHGENGREPNVCYCAEHCSGLQVCARVHIVSERSSRIFYALPHLLCAPNMTYTTCSRTRHTCFIQYHIFALISLFPSCLFVALYVRGTMENLHYSAEDPIRQ